MKVVIGMFFLIVVVGSVSYAILEQQRQQRQPQAVNGFYLWEGETNTGKLLFWTRDPGDISPYAPNGNWRRINQPPPGGLTGGPSAQVSFGPIRGWIDSEMWQPPSP